MREEEVGRMREEIGVLRARVAEGGSGVATTVDGGDGVPRETYENLQREKEELEEVVKQKEKRLLRLKSVRYQSHFFVISKIYNPRIGIPIEGGRVPRLDLII